METSARTVLRRATSADASTLQELLLELAGHENSLEHVFVTAEGWADLLTRDDVIVLLAEDTGGRAVGYVSVVRRLALWQGGDILAIDDLYVRPGHRNAGLGRRLMLAVASLASQEGLTVQWGVALANTSGQRFYSRLGATLITKMIAVWPQGAYSRALTAETLVTA
jgi:GNAT superfamily N-acetyltransferase